MRVALLALAVLVAPALAKAPLPQMKPCLAIDETMHTDLSAERIWVTTIRVAKTAYNPEPPDAKKVIYDRVPVEPETQGER